MKKTRVVLVVIDGWGVSSKTTYNAIHTARTPTMDALTASANSAILEAHGELVGLPKGVMGNSEIGHLTIGSGRALRTDIVRINGTSFSECPNICNLLKEVRRSLHLVIMISDASVHSHLDHLYRLLELIAENHAGITKINLHCITDGRDCAPKSAHKYVRELQDRIEGAGLAGRAGVASLGGRYYYMDRDKKWDRTDLAVDALLGKAGGGSYQSAGECVEGNYGREVTDEFIKPAVIEPNRHVQQGDSGFFMNFRPDRIRQLVARMRDRKEAMALRLYSMTCYNEKFDDDVSVVFPVAYPDHVLADYVAGSGLTQLHVAETEKYAHVTYFFNGRREQAVEGEQRKMVDSPRDVRSYDLKPRMSMPQVGDLVVESVKEGHYDLVVCNLAAPDMVGHTGKMGPAVEACEECDKQIEKIRRCCIENGAVLAVTADHGNAEDMFDEENETPRTSHTTNPVPLVVEGYEKAFKRKGGTLCDVAPTVLDLLGIERIVGCPMTGRSLFK